MKQIQYERTNEQNQIERMSIDEYVVLKTAKVNANKANLIQFLDWVLDRIYLDLTPQAQEAVTDGTFYDDDVLDEWMAECEHQAENDIANIDGWYQVIVDV